MNGWVGLKMNIDFKRVSQKVGLGCQPAAHLPRPPKRDAWVGFFWER
jgi:hypothetical protein